MFSLICSQVQADELEEFLLQVDSDFEIILNELSKDERKTWLDQSIEITNKVSKFIDEQDELENYFKAEGVYDKYKSTLPFTYLKNYYSIKLDMKTNLVEKVGEYSFNKYYENNVKILLNEIELELTNLQNSQGALQLQTKLTQYFKVKRSVDLLLENPPIKVEYEYKPASSAWDTEPLLLKKYVLYDWIKGIQLLSSNVEDLKNINDSFVSFNKLKLNDPIAYISFGSQIAVLLVVVAGYTISYTDKPSILVIFILVISSMALSITMISISSSTILNISIQAILPGSFILYWVFKSHKKVLKQNEIID